MAKIFPGRYTARISTQIAEPYVMLILGIRVNRWPLIWKWLPTMLASLPMVYTLARHRAGGYLGGQVTSFWFGIGLHQYWRSFDDLERFARSKEYPHLKAWRWYNKAIGAKGSVGLWHEVFLVQPGYQEAMYDNMPLFGLAAASTHVPVAESRKEPRLRLGELRETATLPLSKVSEGV